MEKRVKKIRIAALVAVMAVTVMTLNMNAQVSKVNFSGSWVLNAEKSNSGQAAGQGQGQGQRMGGLGGNFTAKQESNLLSVESTREGRDGTSRTTVNKYTLDGKESINSTGRGDSKSVATWSADGKKLTIKTSRTIDMNGESRTVSSTEEWSLTDAKTLSVITTMATPNGERKATAVYNKK
ncbi:MAG: hypothetical protein E4G92_05625 [Bacteroidia bacterium]|nr:MAG: hypothetical protein E4G92_05625 [Bacteroidia bacterium]